MSTEQPDRATRWDKTSLQALLERSASARVRALAVIYAFQLEEEKRSGMALHENGQGFNEYDAKILTSFAKKLLQGYNLSSAQHEVLAKRIGKYWKQLLPLIEVRARGRVQKQGKSFIIIKQSEEARV